MRLMQQRKMNLRTLDFPRTGWWVWHTAAIAGVYMLGKMVTRRQPCDY